MLKLKIAVLIAGGLLGAHVNLAAAQGTFPSSSDEVRWDPLPAQVEYFKQGAASNPNLTGASRPAFPTAASSSGGTRFPAMLKYFDQRAASTEAASAAGQLVKITPSTTYVNVDHEEIVTIENAKGQRFVWKADTLGEADMALQQVAPKDFAAGSTRIFVRHPYAHLRTE